MESNTSCACKEYLLDYDVDNKITHENCYINSDKDLLIILYKLFVENSLNLVFQRLSFVECQKFIKPGNLFVIVEKNSSFMEDNNSNSNKCKGNGYRKHLSNLELQDGITRWTDKLLWTSSRMLNKKFLVYKQKGSKTEQERLIKKTLSIKIDGKSIRLISYYNEESVKNGSIKSISDIYKNFDDNKLNEVEVSNLKKKIKEINISGYTNSSRSLSDSIDARLVFNDFENVHNFKDERRNSVFSKMSGSDSTEISTLVSPLPPLSANYSYQNKQVNKFVPPSNKAYFQMHSQQQQQHQQQAMPTLQNVTHQYFQMPKLSFVTQSSFQPMLAPEYTLAVNTNPLIQYQYPTISRNSTLPETTNVATLNDQNALKPVFANKTNHFISPSISYFHTNQPIIHVPIKIQRLDSTVYPKHNKTLPKLPSMKDLQLPRF